MRLRDESVQRKPGSGQHNKARLALNNATEPKTKVLDDTLPRDEMKLASLGGKDVAYNPYALQPGQAFQHTMSPDGAANNALGYARLNFDKAESAASDQPGKSNETMAKQIAAYKSAPLGQFSLNKPWGQATMDRVLELNPQYDGAQYAPRAAALRAYRIRAVSCPSLLSRLLVQLLGALPPACGG